MVDPNQIGLLLRKSFIIKMDEVEIHDNGTVDVHGDVQFTHHTDLPVKFGSVHGFFDCSNLQMDSLAGSPRYVEDFYCDKNRLTTLEQGPHTCRGDYMCQGNSLINLVGAPTTVPGDFVCYDNDLVSLEGSPQEVGFFACQKNDLESLVGGPTKTYGDYDCSNNLLHNLVGAPERVPGVFDCTYNALKSCEGMPQEMEEVRITWSPNLPLLRCLVASKIRIVNKPPVAEIMNDPRWVGKGKKGSLMCAAALIRAGFEGNAKW